VPIVLFGWAIQHIALPLVPDWRYIVLRATAFLPLGLIWIAVFLRTRRLFPFIVAHWGLDLLER
jgi:CAAX prenyl protease-like protein